MLTCQHKGHNQEQNHSLEVHQCIFPVHGKIESRGGTRNAGDCEIFRTVAGEYEFVESTGTLHRQVSEETGDNSKSLEWILANSQWPINMCRQNAYLNGVRIQVVGEAAEGM